MDIGRLILVVLLAFVTAAFAVGAAKGLRGQGVTLPQDSSNLVYPDISEVPPKYSRVAGSVMLDFAVVFLVLTVSMALQLVRGA